MYVVFTYVQVCCCVCNVYLRTGVLSVYTMFTGMLCACAGQSFVWCCQAAANRFL